MEIDNTFRNDTKKFKSITDGTKYCKCGHAIAFAKYTKRVICNWCGHWVYNNKEDEFKDRLLQKKKRLENEN